METTTNQDSRNRAAKAATDLLKFLKQPAPTNEEDEVCHTFLTVIVLTYIAKTLGIVEQLKNDLDWDPNEAEMTAEDELAV